MSDVYERLSTGQRINRAADDAAGLSIAEALTSNKRVFGQGLRNLNDGISALSIADSAVEALTQITTRIYELAEQGANGSYSVSQRAALDKEAQVLRAEFLRVVQSSSFNGRNLLDGSVQGLGIQAGYGTNGLISASVGGNKGTGSFGSASNYTAGSGPTSVAATDLNGDGNLDLVAANQGSSTVSVLLGNGNGTFGAATSSAVGANPYSVATGDFNGDGRIDVISANAGASAVSVLLGNGDGTLAAATSFGVGSFPSTVIAADVNGDGRTDILTANIVSNSVSVLLGNGNGSFATASSVSTGSTGTSSVATTDFNNDGRLDLVTANLTGNNATVLLGNGDGTFGAASSIMSLSGPRSVASGDFNGDGAPDIVAAASGGSSVSVVLGNGNGTFGAATTITVGTNPYFVTTADFNGDGRADIVAANFSAASNSLSVVLGNGDGTFGSATNFSVGTNPNSVFSADLNRDGVTDLAATFATGLSVLTANTQDGVQPIVPVSLKTQADSIQALPILARKLELLAAQRGVIGAAQSRFGAATQALSGQREGYIAANSRIRDADVAQETAELARVRIVQESATAIMAQANQQPALALQLLR